MLRTSSCLPYCKGHAPSSFFFFALCATAAQPCFRPKAFRLVLCTSKKALAVCFPNCYVSRTALEKKSTPFLLCCAFKGKLLCKGKAPSRANCYVSRTGKAFKGHVLRTSLEGLCKAQVVLRRLLTGNAFFGLGAFFFFFLRLFLVYGALVRLLLRLEKAHKKKTGQKEARIPFALACLLLPLQKKHKKALPVRETYW